MLALHLNRRETLKGLPTQWGLLIWTVSKAKAPGTEPKQVAGVESRRGRLGNKVRTTEEE